MKIKDVIEKFEIFITNEEHELLEKIGNRILPRTTFTERERFILENLVRKSLIQKIQKENDYHYRKNLR